MMTEEFKDNFGRCVLCWLASIGEDGMPNVSPKEVFVTEGDRHILIAHIASPKSVRNIRRTPNVCLSFVDVFVQRGYKVNGTASIIEKTDAAFETRGQALKNIAGEKFPIQAIIDIKISSIVPIIAPRYKLHLDTTEAAQIGRAIKTYNRVLEKHGQHLQ